MSETRRFTAKDYDVLSRVMQDYAQATQRSAFNPTLTADRAAKLINRFENMDQIVVALQQAAESERVLEQIVPTLTGWLENGYTENETPLDGYGAEVLREVIAQVRAILGRVKL